MNTYERLGRAIAEIYFPEATMNTPDTTVPNVATVNFDDFCKQMEITHEERELLVHHLGAIRSRETVKALQKE